MLCKGGFRPPGERQRQQVIQGKPEEALAGAAKVSSMKKCCETSAVGKDGKKVAGAAKTSFMKKCEAGT
jgi:hypothetical protein